MLGALQLEVPQDGAQKAHDVSSYITKAMLQVQMKSGSVEKYVGSTDKTLKDNEGKHVEMVKLLRWRQS